MKKVIALVVFLLLIIAVPAIAFMQYDPLVSEQWYLDKINIYDAWDITKGDREIVVAVLDTGVDISHPDLAGNIWVNMDEVGGDGIDNDKNGYIDDVNGYDFVYDWADPAPDTSWDYDEFIHHGTFIAGIIAAVENGKGIMGVANKVRIMPVKVLDEFGYGYSEVIDDAVDYAIDNGADIINLSLTSFESDFEAGEAIKRAAEKNIIVVAASGNEWIDMEYLPIYPVCFDENDPNVFIIGVGSTDADDWPSLFSNYGKECVDISAPGESMFSTRIHTIALSEDEYYGGDVDGTSYSAAVVTGVIALMKSLNRSLSPAEIVEAFKNGVDPVSLDFFMEEGDMGYGRLNAHKSLQQILTKYGISKSKFPWKIAVSQQSKGEPTLKILNRDFGIENEFGIYESEFTDGMVIDVIDVNNDGTKEYVAAPAKGSPNLMRILSLEQKLLASKYVFEKDFTGGVSLSSITLEDGTNKILACSGQGRQTEYWFVNEKLEREKAFMPFNDQNGCNAAAGDIDGDGIEEVVVASLKDPVVKIFDQKGNLINSFTAYGKEIEGAYLDVADLNKDGSAEIVTGPYKGSGPVKLFDKDGKYNVSFNPYNGYFAGGVKVKVTKFDEKINSNIVTVPGMSGGPHLRIFDLLGNVVAESFVYDAEFDGGVNIAVWE